jgi:hypothetical protein
MKDGVGNRFNLHAKLATGTLKRKNILFNVCRMVLNGYFCYLGSCGNRRTQA